MPPTGAAGPDATGATRGPGTTGGPAGGLSGEPDTSGRRPGEAGWLPGHLPALSLASAGSLGLAAMLGSVLAGEPGALGAAVGVGVVSMLYLASTVLIAWGAARDPRLVMPLGMASYVTKLALVTTLLYVVADDGWSGLPAMAYGVVAGVAGWSVAHVWWVARWASRRLSAEVNAARRVGEHHHDRVE